MPAMTSEEITTPEKAAPVSSAKPESADAAAADVKPSGDSPPAENNVKHEEDKKEKKEEKKEVKKKEDKKEEKHAKKKKDEAEKKKDEAEKKKGDAEKKPTEEAKEPAKQKRGRTPRKPAAAAVAVAPSPAREGMRRDRKKVERLSEVIDKQYQLAEETRIVLPKGNGTALKDCPRIMYFVCQSKPEDLKLLHSLIFNRSGKASEVRKNLLEFNGFEFGADSKEYEKMLDKASGKKIRDLKKALYALDLERSAGNNRQLAERVCRFLLRPSDNGKKPPHKPTLRPQRGRKRKSAKASDSADDDDDEGADSEKITSDSEDEAPKAKKPRRQAAGRRRAASAKKSPAKRKRKAKPASSEEDEPSSVSEDEMEADEKQSDNEDDVPLKQLKKSEPPASPTDDEIKKLVNELLDGADMETLTVKSVIAKVFAKYEGVDLTDRKDFIRDTIKEALN